METKCEPPESNSKNSGPCAICGTLATHHCSGCENGPYYCGKEHQIQHWKTEHRKICSGVTTVLDPFDGTTVLHKATRALKTGHVILKRSPIVVFPRQLNPVEFPAIRFAQDFYEAYGQNAHEVMMPCLGCCQIIPYNKVTRDPIRGYCQNVCSHCQWPIHDIDCERIHKVECDYLKSRGIKISKHPRIFYWIGFLRAVLLKKAQNPDWYKLMKMPYRPGIVKETDKNEMRSFIFNDCKLSDVISTGELDKLIDLCFHNFLVCNHNLNSGRARLAFIIYKSSHGQVLTHSCTPNSYAYIDKDTFQATFRTIRPVGIGETLTIDFDPRSPCFYGFADRITNFQRLSVKMPCRCARCAEPTENGTYYSALRCTNKKCKDGWLNPSLLPQMQQCMWICKSCMGDPREGPKPGSNLKPLMESDVQQIIGKLQREISRGAEIGAVQEILDKNVPSVLHPNHYLVHHTLTNLAIQGTTILSKGEQYIFPNGQLNLASFNLHKMRMFGYFERVVELNQLTQPGRDFLSADLSFYRGLLLISQLMEEIAGNGENMKLSDYVDRCEKILETITNSLETLELDPLKEETRCRDDRKLSLRLYTMALEAIIVQGEAVGEIPPVFKKLVNKWSSIPDGPNTPETPAGLSLEDEIKFRVGLPNSEGQVWQFLTCDYIRFLLAMK